MELSTIIAQKKRYEKMLLAHYHKVQFFNLKQQNNVKNISI